jgi:hypothetical protein
MSNENDKSDSLGAIERALAGFSPAPPQIDRDRLMFFAGRANALANEQSQALMLPTRHNRLWPAATATFAATSLALAGVLAFQTASPPTIVRRDRPVSAPAAQFPQPAASLLANHFSLATPSIEREQREASGDYLKIREIALRMGLDALGSQPYSAAPDKPTSYRDLWVGLTSASNSQSDKPEKQPSM